MVRIAFLLIFLQYLNQSLAQSVKIDLSYQFSPVVAEQIGGSCHVYAQTALLEAACYRATGKHLDLSEGKAFEEHLLDQLQDQAEKCVQTQNLARLPGYQIVSSHVDGTTKSAKTLSGFLYGDVCAESEFPTSRKAFREIQMIVDSLKNYTEHGSFVDAANQTKIESKKAEEQVQILQKKITAKQKKLAELKKNNEYYKSTLEILLLEYHLYLENSKLTELKTFLNNGIDRLTEHQKSRIDLREKSTFAAINKILNDDIKKAPKETSSPSLKKCLSKKLQFDAKRPGTKKDILALLNAKKPILCSGNVEGIGYHETLIVGYRYSPQGKIEYLLRDSQMAAYLWGMKFDCDEIVWIL